MKKKYVIVGTMMLLIGMVGVNAATSVPSNGVLYSNSNSSVTTVEGALNELYTNYNNLLSKGDASASNILTGKKVLVKGKEVTGTMANNGSVSKALAAGGSYTIPAGYHDGTGKVTANSLASQTSATATAAQILKDKTAYVNGSKVTGTMANKAGTTVKASAVSSDDNNTYLTIPTAGYYDQNSKIYSESSNLGGKFVYGTADIGAVITLPFTPNYVMIWNPKYETNARIEIYDNGKSYHNDIDSTTAFSSGMSWSKLDGNVITIGKHSKESCTQKIYIAWQ